MNDDVICPPLEREPGHIQAAQWTRRATGQPAVILDRVHVCIQMA